MGHNHNHSGVIEEASWRLALAFFANLIFSIIEVVAGLSFNSSAILADAVHNMSDNFSLGFAWGMHHVSSKERDKTFSYGYKRFSTVAALLNTLILLVGSVLVLRQTIPLLLHPVVSNAKGMIIVALIGIIFNGFAVFFLRKGKSLNEQVVTLHQMEDVLSEVGIVIVGVVLLFWHIPILDPLLSLLIVSFLLYNGLRRFWQVLKVFLQAVPDGRTVEDIESKLLTLENIVAVHDTHAWSLDGESMVITTHIVIDAKLSDAKLFELKCRAKDILFHLGGIHSTVEIEREGERCDLQNC